jgi:RHS repeat-associated protein
VGFVLGPNGYPEAPLASIHPNNLQAMLAYTESYQYDPVGNLLQTLHQAAGAGWTRTQTYLPGTNRLNTVSMPGDPASGPYSGVHRHDAAGNIVQMPNLATMTWDHAGRLVSANLGGGGTAYFVYDAAGNRVRKVIARSGQFLDRVYVGEFERYRELAGTDLPTATITLERQSLHVHDGERRFALLETNTVDTSVANFSVSTLERFQFPNHLGSACLETDPTGNPISYEEYYSFGGSSFRSGDSNKRYRFASKERDEETGLYYFGARYYAPWLGRWTSCDPGPNEGSRAERMLGNRTDGEADIDDSSSKRSMIESPPKETGHAHSLSETSLYLYVGNNPIARVDPDGRDWWTNLKEGWFGARHPFIANETKKIFTDDTTTTKTPSVSSLAVRFSTRLGLQENAAHEGSQVNAVRHTTWQAILTGRFGATRAEEIGNTHEEHPDLIAGQDPATQTFASLHEADEATDLRNNLIGRAIGEKGIVGNKGIVSVVLRVFHEQGLWVAEQQADGRFKAVRSKLTDAEYASASTKLGNLDDLGLNPAQAAERQHALDNSLEGQAQRGLRDLDRNIRQLYGVP